MRGDASEQAEMLLALTPDQLVPDDHPIRRIKALVEPVLARLSPRFDEMYAVRGRPSIAPERLLKGLPLRPAVQVVPGPQCRRPRLRPLDLLEEP